MKHAQDYRAERYVLGEMSAEERAAFEEHFFDCPECADDVKATVAFADNARAALAESPPEEAPVPAPLPFPRRFQGAISALAAAAVIALAVGAAFQTLVVVPDLERQLAEARAPQAVGWEFLAVSRSAVPELEAEPGALFLGLRLSRSFERSSEVYVYQLVDDDGVSRQSARLDAPANGEELGLLLPVRELESGAYTIVLSTAGPSGEPEEELARYPFKLRFSS